MSTPFVYSFTIYLFLPSFLILISFPASLHVTVHSTMTDFEKGEDILDVFAYI